MGASVDKLMLLLEPDRLFLDLDIMSNIVLLDFYIALF